MKLSSSILFFLIGSLLLDCSDDDSPSQSQSKNYDVYVAGVVDGVIQYWKNDNPVILAPAHSRNIAGDLVVANDKVYVAGRLPGTILDSAKCWGCVMQPEIESPSNATAGWVAIDGSDEYLFGYIIDNEPASYATCWKNGKKIYSGGRHSEPKSIFVKGGDVHYITQTNSKSEYYKNGILSDAITGFRLSSVFVSGQDVYISGHNSAAAVPYYWKNGEQQLLEGNGWTYDIFVYGTDAFTCGYYGKYAKYWNNSKEVTLSNGATQSVALSIFVIDSHVYVAGQEGDKATYWVDGKAVNLGNGIATSIFVVEKKIELLIDHPF